MHRVIREYLKEKLRSELVYKRFKQYYEQILLNYAIKLEPNDFERHTLPLEVHNLNNHLKILLLGCEHLSASKGTCSSGIPVSENLLQVEKLHKYYKLYIWINFTM